MGSSDGRSSSRSSSGVTDAELFLQHLINPEAITRPFALMRSAQLSTPPHALIAHATGLPSTVASLTLSRP